MTVNVNWTVGNVIQIKSGIKICVDASVKIQQKTFSVKKTMFEILLHVLIRIINI